MSRFLKIIAFMLVTLAAPALAQQWPGPLTGTVDSDGQQFSATHNFPMMAGKRTLVPLDVATVASGGVAVNALIAGHRAAGGWIQNPSTASVALCINEQGIATGTTSAGSTTCILPGQSYNLTPAAGAVSVISSDSSHAFSGEGYN